MLSRVYTKININHLTRNLSGFVSRHIGINELDEKQMLEKINVSSIDDLIKKSTFIEKMLVFYKLPNQLVKQLALSNLKSIMSRNIPNKSFIGLGYHNTLLPFPIKRHILENAKWYTAYTPIKPKYHRGDLKVNIIFS